MKKLAFVIVGVTLIGVAIVATSLGQDKKDKKGARPKGFQLGKVLPPHIAEELDLTEEQRKALRELEQETRKKLEKILTAEQREKIEKLGKAGPPKDKGKGPPKQAAVEKSAGIAWFAKWEDGLAEAKRSGKPILLVSAAPHCAGVPGTW